VNFIGPLLVVFSEESKAFLLRGVNKANTCECQGCHRSKEGEKRAKGKEIGGRKKGSNTDGRGEFAAGENLLTENKPRIRSLSRI
jgi:hypothetical protein